MSHRYEVTISDTTTRKVYVDLPEKYHPYNNEGIYRAAKKVTDPKMIKLGRTNSTVISSHYLGEIKDENSASERESGGEVQPSGSTSISVNADATRAEEGNQQREDGT